jgi:rhamnosyltransferase
MKEYSIASVTVAYNSATVLPRQLDRLKSQSRPLDEIIVVDNASSDCTLAALRELYPDVTVLQLHRNLGVGGAFSEGLRYAIHQRGHDWVWLFDDDSLPVEDGLERLLAGLTHLNGASSKVGILAPVSMHEGTALQYLGLLWRRGWRTVDPKRMSAPVVFVDAVISSGALVSRRAVLEAGLPRADFFMDFVDFEHCLRLRRHGFLIGMVSDCRMNHSIGNPRNARFIAFSRAWSDHSPWREYYIARNETFTIWSYYPDWRSKMSVMRKLLRHAAGIAIFGQSKGACLRMLWLGFQDGRLGRLGIRFSSDTK